MNHLHPDASILVLAKAPVAGEVKTRLSPVLTPRQSASLHRLLVTDTLERVCETPIAPVTLYCSPDETHPFFQQCRANYPVRLRAQRGGDLGQRMLHALSETLPASRYAILIGTDCPSMDAGYLKQALDALAHGGDAVIGPATDGGYVLIGMRHVHRGLFESIAWGGSSVLEQTRERLRNAGLSWRELRPLHDIDRPEDLELLPESLHFHIS